MIRVDILDSSPIFLLGLTQLLSDNGIRVVNARTHAESAPPTWLADVFLIDPEALSDDAVQHVTAAARLGATLVLSASILQRDLVDALMGAGASGVISKRDPADALVAAVHAVAAGRAVRGAETERVVMAELAPYNDPSALLSEREEQVLQQIAHGLTHSQIARRLGISRYTVDTYVKRIRAKLGVGNKAELTRVAMLRKFSPAWHSPSQEI